MSFCGKCGTEILHRQNFCASCGTPIQEHKSSNIELLLDPKVATGGYTNKNSIKKMILVVSITAGIIIITSITYYMANLRRSMAKDISFKNVTEAVAINNGETSKVDNKETYEEYTSEDFIVENGVLTRYVGNDSTVIIPKGIVSIGEKAFANNLKLNSITIPNGVVSIRYLAFFECYNLVEVIMPASIVSIGTGAFGRCGLSHITIPQNVKSIEAYAFGNCERLKSVDIPDSEILLGEGVFEATPWYDNAEGLLIVAKNLIKYTGNESTLIIPDGVRTIGYGAFGRCTSLNSVTMPDTITEIGMRAFAGGVNII